jgi:pimeloyl-ACP methyl ester carboxylesterase
VTASTSVASFHAADGVRLGLHVIGEGPPLVCVPGGPGRASEYLEDLAGLSRSRTLLRLDMRGTGTSELPDDRDSMSFPRLADDIEALRISRGLDSIDLLGHSAGCLVSLVYAARYPGRVSRLVLVTPSGAGFGDVADDVARIRASRSAEPWYAEVAAIEAEVAKAPPHRRERVDRGLRPYSYGRWDERTQAHAAATDSQMSLRAAAAFLPESFDHHAFLAALWSFEAQTLVVVGDMDGMTGVTAGHLVAGVMRTSRVIEIAGAGHYPWVDEPEEFRGLVTRFLTAAHPAAPRS